MIVTVSFLHRVNTWPTGIKDVLLYLDLLVPSVIPVLDFRRSEYLWLFVYHIIYVTVYNQYTTVYWFPHYVGEHV